MSEQKQPARWYIVADKADGASCLVEASNRLQAFRRAGEFYCTARPATVDEALRMAKEGRDVIYAPNAPEQLDLEEQAGTGVPAGEAAPAGKEEKAPVASETSDAAGSLTCDGEHGGPPCADPNCWAREPATARLTDVVPEVRKEPHHDDPSPALARTVRPPPRRAADVFGAGFAPKSAADSVD